MNVTIIGTGYVGLVTGACFADFGVNVVCVDKDGEKIRRLNNGDLPIYEPGLKELVLKNLKEKRLSFTTDIIEAIKKSLVVFIAVGTPPRGDGGTDLSYIEEVAGAVAGCLNGYKVVATKSTVPVGTSRFIEKIIKEKNGKNYRFDVASNPEFLREGSAIEDFMRPDRVVIGTGSEYAAAILRDLYSPLYLIETPFIVTDIQTAELIKYATNAYLATKISFINEMANLCEKTGANVRTIAKAMGIDKRIGAKFLHPGPGFGGSCLPKDITGLVNMADKLGYDFKIVKATIEVNRNQRLMSVEKIKKASGGIKDKTIGALGLTFKPNTDDIRESPAVDIIKGLVCEGADVKVYDPAGMDNARGVLPSAVAYCSNPYEAAKDSDCLVIMTEWNQFRKLDMERIKGLLKSPLIVDLRNVYEASDMEKMGFRYVSMGRGDKYLLETGQKSPHFFN